MGKWRSLGLLAMAVYGCGELQTEPLSDAGDTIDASPPPPPPPPPAPSDASLDTTPPSEAGVDAGPDARPGLVPVPAPPPPTFPSTIGTLSVGLRTATTAAADTDDPLEICLSATRCFPLALRDVNDFRLGGADVYQFEGVGMPRSEVDRVVLRTLSPLPVDNDRYTPACLDLRFDGEPVYCNDAIGVHIGTGTTAGEVPEWTDPAGLRNACTSCLSGKLPGGPVVGAPGADSARVWVRTDATRQVGLYMSEQADGTGAVPVAWAYPRPEKDFTAVLTAPSLQPDRRYSYRVVVDGAPSEPFRPIRTAPSASAKVRLAMGSCARSAAQPIYGPLKAANLDMFLFLGDNHYGNSPYIEAHRWQYRRLDAMALRREFLASVPALATWDDHDFVANNSDGACGGREDALRGFAEAWPNPSFGTATTPGAFTKARLGPVEVILADCRYYRPRVNDPEQRCTLEGAPVSTDFINGPLGAAQFTWLVDSIANSTAAFKLVGCGSLFTSTGIDSWRSFPEARTRLFDELAARNVGGVVLVSGDIHRSEVRVMPRTTGYPMLELVSSAMAQFPVADNPGRAVCNGTDPLRRFCYPWDAFTSVEVDATVADPSLVAVIHDEQGVEKFRHRVLRSELR